MVKLELGYEKYVASPQGSVYYDIMNSDAVQKLLLKKAEAVERAVRSTTDEFGDSKVRGPERTGYTFSVSVKPGLHRAHAYVFGKLPAIRSYEDKADLPKSFEQMYHNRKWGKRLDVAMQQALDSISE